ncbi:SpsE Sialic acid synthase [uncultured Caudovirales phage]|uniref:SpsE Sialic acid synthase n=1 Tax=uncultured Caudovirales phage TaxID=2100421 RepID=A0A6J5T6Q7_9CAUD|nr:SpsE Sialic acid synthase [uncultured Caudovirales phage]
MKQPFIVAECSGNHNGDLQRALQLVQAAKDAGADAVKIQTFTPEQMVDPDLVIETGPWAGQKAIDLYRQTHYPREWHVPIFNFAHDLGLVELSSVFHRDDVDFLETIGCPIYKIASAEATDLDLIEYTAETGKPMIISTGMCSWEQMVSAVDAARRGGCMDLTLLKCTTSYPAPIEEANLLTMDHIRHGLNVDAGLSDHTMGWIVPVAAVAAGAQVIEKHLTLSRDDGGPDAAFSMEPKEFKNMVEACRIAATAMGKPTYEATASERQYMHLKRPPAGKRGECK